MILNVVVCLKEIVEQGRDFPWSRPKRCPKCNGDRVWGHGFVSAIFDGFAQQALLRRFRCPDCRCVAIREPMSQPDLPGLDLQRSLPFPTMDFGPNKYKLFGIVTNRDLPADELIWWCRRRCGKSEEVHALMKRDLAGGKFPSGKFGVNAAWWQMMVLALNLNSAMKSLVLGGNWVSKRFKAIRFWLINLPGRVAEHSGELIIRLAGGHPSNETLLAARRRILALNDTG